MEKKKSSELLFLKVVMFLSAFLIGGYHMAVSCALSSALLFYIIYKSLQTNKKLKAEIGLTVLSVLLLTVSYLVVCLWAVDRGTAVYGFFKLLPVALFTVIVSGYESDKRMELLDSVPMTAVINGVLAYALSFIPAFKDFFLVADRLGGFFQSPNVFALYCLSGIIILLTSEKMNIKKWAVATALTILIFLTGSRTVFVLLALTVVILFFTLKNKKLKRNIILIFFAVLGVSVLAVFITDSVQTVGRFLTISLESSTFLGRLLYFRDAIPVILKHPFGLGYYGYYFSQGSFQTGVYSVAFVHNSVLQFLLDVGFVPAVFFTGIIGASFFSKNANLRQRVLLLVVFGHSLFDFDLEFTCVFLVLILTLDFDIFRKKTIELNKIAIATVSTVLIFVSVYFGLINTLYLLGQYKTVDKMYGYDTMSKVNILTTEKNASMVEKYADEIIDRNGYLAIAYDAKANIAYSNGDFKTVIEYKNRALENAPYSRDEYIDYCEKMMIGISLYESVSDEISADFCRNTLIGIKEKADETLEKTSSLGWKIYDKPDLELPKKYVDVIEEFEKGGENK